MAQQTAVDFLFEVWNSREPFNKFILDEQFEEAKKMEKEQIKNAYWNGTTDMEKEDALLMAEDYFNDYYKK